MKDEAVAQLIDYLSGELGDAERQAIEEQLEQSPALQAKLEELRQLQAGLQALPVHPSPTALHQDFQDLLEREIASKTSHFQATRHFLWLWQAAAAVVLLLLGIFIGRIVTLEENNQRELVAVQQELEVVKASMEELMQQSSTSRRIKAVNLTFDLPEVDEEVLDNLGYLLLNDESVNVRLAALEALERLATRPNVKRILVDALRHQDRPIVQIALINILAEIEAKAALPVLEEIINDESVPASVKDEAVYGRFKMM